VLAFHARVRRTRCHEGDEGDKGTKSDEGKDSDEADECNEGYGTKEGHEEGDESDVAAVL